MLERSLRSCKGFHAAQRTSYRSVLFLVFLLFACCIPSLRAEPQLESEVRLDPPGIWKDGVGSGFHKGRMNAGFGFGAGPGLKAFGSEVSHDLAMGLVSFGWMMTEVMALGKWYAGNLELRGELFGGAQFDPETAHFVGLTPFLRYNVATGRPFVPFIEGGAGVSETDIGEPDLSTRFQFNLQAGAGVHCFFQQNKAITFQSRLLHFSNAYIDTPNNGVDTIMFIVGMNWFF